MNAAAVSVVPSGPIPALTVYSWWRLAFGQIVEIRKFQTVDGQAQCVVRYIYNNAELAPGEFTLTLRFLRMHG